ncbi:MAG: EamA family transporter [Alicycliphilus sp.]|jgi:drug/metabolite transporter (DMT)-like permease|nr:EamA family transporter [Alicycliphilus sp.]MBP7324573.1 EamA family transporter [Alicycliphilus sp.]MBP7328337.1 EamA family transporter [Alicycliphilus sp.]MBP8137717.1 EamA family transporter [Alicycliphilus sp.]MBP8778251.1 EamA family transporter [Alicycliphilus sp.]
MSLNAFALIILAGLIHAVWNIAAKKAGGDARFAFFTAVLMMLVWAPLGWWLGRSAVPLWGAREWAIVALSGVLHVLYYVVLLRGYRKADLTVVYPLARGTGPLVTALVAVTLLGERLSLTAVLGIAGVVAGVFLIAGGPGLLRAGRDEQARRLVRKGMQYGVLTGLFIASYTVVDGYAVKVMLLSPILVDYMGNFVRVLVLAPVALRKPAELAPLWAAQWRFALLVAAVSPVAYVLVLFAMQSAPLSHVAPAREVSMLFAALLGGHLLGEGDRAARLAGALLIACGVVALALG